MSNYLNNPLTTQFPLLEIKPDFGISSLQLPGMQLLMQKDLMSSLNQLENTYLKGLGQFSIGALGSSSQAINDLGKDAMKTAFNAMNNGLTKNIQSFITPTTESSGNGLAGFLGKASPISQGINLVGNIAQSLGGVDPENASIHGGVAKGLSAIQGIAGNFGPYGQAVSAGIGALTSVMNIADAIGGKRADTITRDDQAFETVGASYTGSNDAVNDALLKSGKKYGLLNSGGRNKANEEIEEAKRQQSIIASISSNALDRFAIQGSMSAINGNRRAFNMQGGYDQSAIRVGKLGLKISPTLARATILKYLKGKKIVDPFLVYLESLPENQKDSSNYRVKDYWEFNGRPKNFDEALSKGMFSKDKKGLYHAKSVQENPETGEIEYMKASNHPTRYMESDWYEKGLVYSEDDNGNISVLLLNPEVEGYNDWKDFTSNYELVKTDPYWKYVKRSTPMKKEGGSITELITPTEIKLVFMEDLPEFQEGGSINVIPEGALHARKHNMDMEGITQKGIPVVSNNEIQQAEIERLELIIRLEVTLKLEELLKKFYNENTSKKEKDELALEAGKLLVYEILHNTQDNTNNLL